MDDESKVQKEDKVSVDDLKQVPGGLTPDELEKVSGGDILEPIKTEK
jgi:hypothetical protein